MAVPRAAGRAHAAARTRAHLHPPERHRRASARASGSRRGTMAFAALKERAQRICARARRAIGPCRLRSRSAGRAGRSSAAADARARRAPRARADSARSWRELRVRGARSRRGSDGVGRARRRPMPLRLGRAARRRALAAYADDVRGGTARPGVTGASRPPVPAPRPATWRRGSSCAPRSSRPTFELLDELLARRVARGAAAGGRAARLGVGRVERPRGATTAPSSWTARPRRAACTCGPAPRELARASRMRPPATSCPTSR